MRGAILSTLLLLGGCMSGARPGIDQVLERVSAEWLAIPGVVGTGTGVCDGRPCLKVFVSERTPEVEARIPPNAGGYPVRIEVTGRVRAR